MKKLHLVCNAHIDTIWQWEWGEGMSAALSTFQSASNLAKKHDYIFCHNESSLYKYTEKYAPELFEDIKNLVRSGKWHITGGWYLQPDCLLSSGESYIRQIREGKLFFEEKFGKGVFPETAIALDAFGHSRGLVQIIKKCGQDNYLFVRPYSHFIRPDAEQLELPEECFVWEGYDGSRIKAYRATEYASTLGFSADKIKKDISRMQDKEVATSLWGVGNHGGGPSDKDLCDIEKLIAESDIEILHSTPDAYFSEMNPTKVFSESLISCMPGCYTSMVGLKQKYRELERELFFVEKMLTAAALRGAIAYPTDKLKDVTEDLMTVMFHDVLPGTVIKAGEDNSLRYINHGLKELEQLKYDCFFALVKGEKPAEENTYPIFVFNPKTYGGKQLVECELSIIPTEFFENEFSHIEIYDGEGNRLEAQTVKESSNVSIDWRKKVVFFAELAPLGITRFTAKTVVKPNVTYPCGEDIVFDNGEKSIKISRESGLIESYCVNGKEYARGEMFKLYSYDDTADPWAMSDEERLEGLGKNPVPFELLKDGDGVFCGLHSLEITEDGPVYLAAEAFFASGLTRARIGYKIYKQGAAVDIDVDIFPAEANKCVKIHSPVYAEEYIGEQVFGTEALYMDGRECVAHNFVAMRDGDEYLEILTPDSFGSSYKDGEVRITLLRNPTYVAHPQGDRPLTRSNIFLPKIDQGQRSFRMRMLPSVESRLQYNADAFAERPFAINIFPTIDRSSACDFDIKTSNEEISVVTMFKSREADGYIVRLQNNSQAPASCELFAGDSSISLEFARYEVKTLSLQNGELSEIDEFII